MPPELRFRAMGTRCSIVVNGDRGHLGAARRRIEDLERRWSRFGSGELTRLCQMAGAPRRVSEETFMLIERSVAAWRLTGGVFDPSVRGSMLANGYDRNFADLDTTARAGRATTAPGLGGVLLDPRARTVHLPEGVAIDPGGIGKGLAADLVTAELIEDGAAGALVSLGGDLRARGDSGCDSWVVRVDDPYSPSRELARIAVDDGGVATSSRLRRVWRRGPSVFHHLVDPAGGRPAGGDVHAASVLAGSAWWAEALATSLVVAGRVPGFEALHRASAIVVDSAGISHATPDLTGCLS